MSFRTALEATGIRGSAACLAFILLLGAIARAEDSTSKNTITPGNVEFDYADAPAANVELDLSQGMFHDLFGIGDAAVAGVADALAKSSGAKQVPKARNGCRATGCRSANRPDRRTGCAGCAGSGV